MQELNSDLVQYYFGTCNVENSAVRASHVEWKHLRIRKSPTSDLSQVFI